MKKIAIIGAGPAGLLLLKKLTDLPVPFLDITFFEKKNVLGCGMPYSQEGAGKEHITNVSGNEIPQLVTTVTVWLKTLSKSARKEYGIESEKISEYKVLPRLLFGKYLSHQFKSLLKLGKEKGWSIKVLRNTKVVDIRYDKESSSVGIYTDSKSNEKFDCAVIATGHYWPVTLEGEVPGYFDSPYPPSKLTQKRNHRVAIRGSSLTAVDAVRTLALQHGKFYFNGKVSYKPFADCQKFKMILHSRNGLLPAVRFHLNDPHLKEYRLLSDEEIEKNRAENDGFLSLDFVFERNFKIPLKEKDPGFYEKIFRMNLEDFVDFILEERKSIEPFDLLFGEYIEAEKTIKRKEPVYWKEMLGVLSFVMNYPAKYFSAEDTLRLHRKLHPLISVVIAYMPQSSVEELLALHKAGILELKEVSENSFVESKKEGGAIYHYDSNQVESEHFETFINATGQPAFQLTDFPFKSLIESETASQAKFKFHNPAIARTEKKKGNKDVIIDLNGNYLNVAGLAINDSFQLTDPYGVANENIFIMAVPFISGFNPDYSGLDFCEEASEKIITKLLRHHLKRMN